MFTTAFALFKSGLPPGWTGWICIIAITFTSALYLADTRMETRDNSIRGFPGCWNMVALVMFATEPNFWIIPGLVTSLALAVFFPLKVIHPVRAERWRGISLPIALVWTFLAGIAAWEDFHPGQSITVRSSAASLCLLLVGLMIQVVYDRKPAS